MADELLQVVLDTGKRQGVGTGIHRRFNIPTDIDLNKVVRGGLKVIMCSMCEDIAEFKLRCNHQLCKRCLKSMHVCPKHITGAQIIYSEVRKLDFTSHTVLCANKSMGCRCEVRLDEFTIHLENCGFRMVDCGRCKGSMPSSELELHLSSSCDWRYYECPFCTVIMNPSNPLMHLSRCPRKKDACCACFREVKCRTSIILKQFVRETCPCCMKFFQGCCPSCTAIIIFLMVYIAICWIVIHLITSHAV